MHSAQHKLVQGHFGNHGQLFTKHRSKCNFYDAGERRSGLQEVGPNGMSSQSCLTGLHSFRFLLWHRSNVNGHREYSLFVGLRQIQYAVWIALCRRPGKHTPNNRSGEFDDVTTHIKLGFSFPWLSREHWQKFRLSVPTDYPGNYCRDTRLNEKFLPSVFLSIVYVACHTWQTNLLFDTLGIHSSRSHMTRLKIISSIWYVLCGKFYCYCTYSNCTLSCGRHTIIHGSEWILGFTARLVQLVGIAWDQQLFIFNQNATSIAVHIWYVVIHFRDEHIWKSRKKSEFCIPQS